MCLWLKKMRVIEFGSEFDWDSNLPFEVHKGKEYFDICGLQKYRSGRDALRAVAKLYQNRTKTVLIPALCCESMVSPFLMNGYKVVFYKMNPDYTANVDDIEIKLQPNCLFLYMPYFGIKPIHTSFLKNWKETFGVICLEDRTHNVLCKKSDRAFIADVTIASIRKWLALPDGGFLWGNENFSKDILWEANFANIRTNAMEKKSLYLLEGGEEIKNSYRNMLQFASELLDEKSNACVISPQSERILNQIDFEKLLLHRQTNVKVLKSLLNPAVMQGKIAYITQKPEESALYFPILVKNRDMLQKKLAEQKIYCPVIWPIPQEAQGVCEVAEYTAKHMLALPCDHRYGVKDMQHIANTLNGLLD